MSKVIDERVLEMRFDNRQFESGVSDTLSSLDKLRKSLNMSGASKGLEGVNAAVKNCDMTGLGSAVETVRSKFSALQIMGVTALANITNSAVNAGKRIVSALTIDPIKTGFQEYETQLNAVQTILANTKSKGKTLDDVNKALDELNLYADKTIYNFTEMTRNIGTFTAAGVDLDTSVSAIKGIANLAAVSGSTSQQASTAMYQLSQALASGTVKLMDWNSVVNAGMGGQVFQDALKETAKVHGIKIDEIIKKQGSFRESLSEGWLTSEILTETLSKFTGDLSEEQLKSMGYTQEQIKGILDLGKTANDAATKVKTFTQLFDTLKEAAQSGWAQTWEIIVGDFEEAKEFMTDLSDRIGGVIGASAEARNKLLQGWKDLGGRKMIIDSISNTFDGIANILKAIGEAFREVFPATTSQQLLTATERIKALTEKFKAFTENSKNIEKIKSVFKGLFSIISIVFTVVKEVAGGIVKLASNFGDLLKSVLDITGSFGDWASGVRDTIKETGFFSVVIGGLVKGIQKVIDVIKIVVGFLKEKIAAPGFQGFMTLMQGIWKVISWIGEKIVSVGKAIGGALADVFKGGDLTDFLGALNSGIFALILVEIKKVIGGLKGAGDGFTSIFDKVGDVFDNVSKVFGSLKDTLKSFQKDIQAKTLLKIAGAVAILTASLVVLSMIDPDKLADSLMAITILFGELMGSMAIFNKIGGGSKGILKSSFAMIAISVAVLILASALKTLSEIDAQGMITGVTGVATLTGIVVAAAKVMSSESDAKVMKGATRLVIFALAIKVLASAVEDMSTLSWGDMIKGLTGVGVLIGAVSLFLNNTKFEGKAVSTGIGIVLLAASMKILASAAKDFASMSWEDLGRGLLGLAGALLAVTLAVNFMPKNMFGIGVGLIAVSTALLIMASALTKMGSMSWEQLGRGLVVLGGSLALLAVGLHAMNGTFGGSAALTIASVALLMLASSLVKMGGMSWEQLGIGLIALGGSLAILAVGLHAMSGTFGGSAALIIAAAAIAILTPSLLLLGSMSWSSLGIGLLALAGAFTILGVAGAVLGPLIPSIVGLSFAMLLLGVGVLALGTGLVLAATGLTALAAAFSASGTIIVAGITAILIGIINLIPSLVVAIGKGIIGICDVIAGSAESICGAIVAIIVAVANALIEAAPPLVKAIFVVLDTILKNLVEYTPKIVAAAVDLIVALLDGLATGLPKIAKSAANLIENFLLAIGEQIPRIVDAGFKMIISFLDGITKAINENTPILVEKMKELFKALLNAAVLVLTGGVVDLKKVGAKIMDSGVIEGIRSKFSDGKKAVSEFIKNAKDKITEKIKDFTSAGKDVISGFIKGIKDKIASVGDAASEVGKKALNSIKNFLGIQSPSKEFAMVGRYSDEGLISGLNEYSGKVASAAGKVGDSALDSMKNSISGMASLIGFDFDAQPTIRPVLDLSNVESGAGYISSMLGSDFGLSANLGAISSTMARRNQNGANDDVVAELARLRKELGEKEFSNYSIGGISYSQSDEVSEAIQTLLRAIKIEGRA